MQFSVYVKLNTKPATQVLMKLLEVEGACAPVFHSWRRHCLRSQYKRDAKMAIQIAQSTC